MASGTLTQSYSVADGTTQSTATYTGNSSNRELFHFQGTGTTAVKFYKNGTLLGTLTSNIPTTSNFDQIVFGVSNAATASQSQSRQMNMFEFTKEMF